MHKSGTRQQAGWQTSNIALDSKIVKVYLTKGLCERAAVRVTHLTFLKVFKHKGI